MLLGILLASMLHSAYAGAATPKTDQAWVFSGEGFLRAEGNRIVDEKGSIILLRGANFFGYEYGLWSMHTELDYRTMASWGFNIVRLPIAWNFIEPQPGRYDDSYFTNYVDRDIAWAKKYGLRIILDMHQYSWSPYFTYFDSWHTAGVPSWAVSSYPNTAEGESRAVADFWSGLGPNGTSPSATNLPMKARFIDMWKHVAGRYVGEMIVAGYDLFNEPSVFSSDGSYVYDVNQFCKETEAQFLETVIDGIRTVDANHMSFWEPCVIHFTSTTLSRHVDRINVAFSPHYPGIEILSPNGYDGDSAKLQAYFEATVLGYAKAWNQPVFVGEWGILVNAPNAAQFIRDFSALLDRNLVGGTWWSYGSARFGSVLFDENGRERKDLTANLVRPYVAASSAPLSTSNWDPNKRILRIDLAYPSTVKAHFPSSYGRFKVTADGVSLSWRLVRQILTASASGACQLVIAAK